MHAARSISVLVVESRLAAWRAASPINKERNAVEREIEQVSYHCRI